MLERLSRPCTILPCTPSARRSLVLVCRRLCKRTTATSRNCPNLTCIQHWLWSRAPWSQDDHEMSRSRQDSVGFLEPPEQKTRMIALVHRTNQYWLYKSCRVRDSTIGMSLRITTCHFVPNRKVNLFAKYR